MLDVAASMSSGPPASVARASEREKSTSSISDAGTPACDQLKAAVVDLRAPRPSSAACLAGAQ